MKQKHDNRALQVFCHGLHHDDNDADDDCLLHCSRPLHSGRKHYVQPLKGNSVMIGNLRINNNPENPIPLN